MDEITPVGHHRHYMQHYDPAICRACPVSVDCVLELGTVRAVSTASVCRERDRTGRDCLKLSVIHLVLLLPHSERLRKKAIKSTKNFVAINYRKRLGKNRIWSRILFHLW